MKQKTTLSQSIDIVEQKAQYDAACKKVLAEKIILAWIMKHTMKEYEAYDVWEIVEQYIVGEPKVGETPILPDETTAPKVAGVGVEDSTVNEGTVTYDIQFRAILPNTDEIVQMIINVEAQNDFYPGYPIIKRGIYYCARMISSQYGTVFTDSHYEKIQKVYSVWICMNPPKLDVLLSLDTTATKKKEVLENDFGIPMTNKMESEVEYMCNLSDGVEQKGIEKGKITVIRNMLKENEPIERICRIVECDEVFVREIMEQVE